MRRALMKIAKNAVAAMAAAALAASMVCAAPAAMAQAAPAQPAAAEAGSTYTVMAKAKKLNYRVNEVRQLAVKVNGKKVKVTKWTSSNKNVVSVSKKGLATAGLNPGKATVTAKFKGGTAKFAITVSDPVTPKLDKLKTAISQPEIAVEDEDGNLAYVMSSEDETVSLIYKPLDEEFTLVYMGDSFTVQMVFDDTSYNVATASFMVNGDSDEYTAGITKATYTSKNYGLNWKEVPENVDIIEQGVLVGFSKMGKFMYDELGVQMSDLGFYLCTFK